jgi:hypothetical protein
VISATEKASPLIVTLVAWLAGGWLAGGWLVAAWLAGG